MTRAEPLVVEEVRGTPISLYGRTLTPVYCVASRLRRRATIEAAHVEARGWGMVTVRPVAVVEDEGGEERMLPIRDVTYSMLRQMACVAVAVSVVAMALVFARRWVRSQ